MLSMGIFTNMHAGEAQFPNVCWQGARLIILCCPGVAGAAASGQPASLINRM